MNLIPKLSLLLLIVPGPFQFALAQQPATSENHTLVPGHTVERELKGGESHSYSLELTAGQLLDMAVEQKGVDVVIVLLDPNKGKTIQVDDWNATEGRELLFVVANVTGQFTLEVRSTEPGAPVGRYEAKINDIRTPTEKDKSRIAANKIYDDADSLSSVFKSESVREANSKFQEALALYRVADDRQGEGRALLRIGGTYSALGQKEQALKFYKESLPVSHGAGDKIAEAQTLNNLGSIYGDLGDQKRGLQFFSESLAIRRSIGDRSGEAATLNNIGKTYLDLREMQQALKYLNESLPIRRAVHDKLGEAVTLNVIGGTYLQLGDKEQALHYFDLSLPLRRMIKDNRGEANTLASMGKVYSDLGKKDQALESLREALRLVRQIGDKFIEVNILNGLGYVYSSMGEKQRALEIYDEALPLARTITNKAGAASTLSNIGKVYSDLGQPQQSRPYFSEALQIFRFVSDKQSEAMTLRNMSRSFALNNGRLSVFYGKLSVNDFQAIRSNMRRLNRNLQQTFLRSVETTYRELADLLLKQGRDLEAAQILNLFKDQQFFDFDSSKQIAPPTLTERESFFATELDRKLDAIVRVTRRLEDLKREAGNSVPAGAEAENLGKLENELAVAKSEYQSILNRVEVEFAGSSGDSDKTPDISDIHEMQMALRDTSLTSIGTTVAVYTLVSENNYRALVITPDTAFSITNPIKGKELDLKAQQLWGLLRTPKYDPRPAANELYKIIFAPIETKLPKGTKTILWSLDGDLRYIPMAALYDGKHYLVERFEDVMFTRADKERMTRAVSPALAGTGMGGSEPHSVELAGDRFNASALPSVLSELDKIFLGRGRHGVLAGTVLLDSTFTRPAMISELKTHRPLVHIASHFKFEPGDEARSFLLLGDGSPFTLDELKTETDLFSGVDLLTLSACETGAQRPDANGREVDGFAELAQRLGAGAVMASLWEVSDNSTSELMARFYRSYRGLNPENKAGSLRRAQLAMLKGSYNVAPTTTDRDLSRDISVTVDNKNVKLFQSTKRAPFAHPYYWSPFVLIGNWK